MTKKKKTETDNKGIKVYHNYLIIAIGTLFAVYAGAILLSINLYQVGKKKMIWIVIPLSMIYAASEQIALNYYGIITVPMTFIINLIGIFLLIIMFWDNKFQTKEKISYRSIWIPLLIAIIIWGPWYLNFIKNYILN